MPRPHPEVAQPKQPKGRSGSDLGGEHRPLPITPANFARKVGVNKSTVSRATKGVLAPAMLPNGKLDVHHPVTVEWLRARSLDRSTFDAMAPRPSAEVAAELGDDAEIPLEGIEGLTLRELTDRHGSDERFHAWTRARKELAMAKRAEEQLYRLRGRLIPRTLVEVLFTHIATLHERLLRDAAASLATQLTRGSFTAEEALEIIRASIFAQLASARDRMVHSLASDDFDAPLRDPSPPRRDDENASARAIRAAVLQIRDRLRKEAAPRIAELFVKPGTPRDAENLTNMSATILEAFFDRAERTLRSDRAISRPEKVPA